MPTRFLVLCLLGLIACTDEKVDDTGTVSNMGDTSTEPKSPIDSGAPMDSGDEVSDTGEDTGEGTATDTGATDTSDTGATNIEPTFGHWTWSLGELISDSCGLEEFDVELEADEGVTLSNNGDGTFILDADSDDVSAVTCTLVGLSFTCEEQLILTEDLSEYGLTGAINVYGSSAGTFTSSTTMEGITSARANCVGSDCLLVELFGGVSFPCASEQAYTGVADQ